MMYEKETLKKIWYDGLNNAFRKTRGPLAKLACHDNARVRLWMYAVVALVFSVVAILLGLLIYTFWNLDFGVTAEIHYLKWLIALCLLLEVILCGTIFYLFRAAYRVKVALKERRDADDSDPFRMRIMKKALLWGIKEGLILESKEGGYSLKYNSKV